jgi:outer membrane lipoprotein-sorting protein
MKLRPLFVAILPLLCLTAQEPTLDQIIQKNLDALGGAAALKAVQSVTIQARMQMQGGALEAPMTMTLKRPNLVRNEVTVQGQTIVMAYDGSKAWMINPMMGSTEPREMPASMASQVTQGTDVESVVGSLAGFRSAGHKLELLGKDAVGGKPVYKVKITRATDESQTYYLDAVSWLPLKTVSTVMQGGQTMEVETFAADFRKVNGLMLAHTTEQKLNGSTAVKMAVEKYTINGQIDDAIFRMPAPAAKPETGKKN